MVSFNRNSILDATFIFLLIMFEHFIAAKVPAELFKFFEENLTAQHVFVFILMYFTLILDSRDHSNSIQSNLVTAVIIYLSYLSFSKSHLYISLIVIGLLVTNLFIDNAIRYYEEENQSVGKLEDASSAIYFAIVVILFISAGIYVYENKLFKKLNS
jgi:hypothetical protein